MASGSAALSLPAGAARFQDIVLSDGALHRLAVEAGVLLWGQWGVTRGDGSMVVSPAAC